MITIHLFLQGQIAYIVIVTPQLTFPAVVFRRPRRSGTIFPLRLGGQQMDANELKGDLSRQHRDLARLGPSRYSATTRNVNLQFHFTRPTNTLPFSLLSSVRQTRIHTGHEIKYKYHAAIYAVAISPPCSAALVSGESKCTVNAAVSVFSFLFAQIWRGGPIR
ncbi:hypothetical protein C8R45DRAFT_270244 [Mycena sanguinolenta]|nr:hypothetical protein C8R45DRAFT_270244 [Mycena sanguinolenta]